MALKANYHKSCYREYMPKVQNLSTSSNEFKSFGESIFYRDVELEAFRKSVSKLWTHNQSVEGITF